MPKKAAAEPAAPSIGALLKARPSSKLPARQIAAMTRIAERMLPVVRAACLSLPETSERVSHGEPTFFVRDKKSFAMMSINHHDDGIVSVTLAAPLGAQAALVAESPEHYYVPPYVGHLGWIGVRLDRDVPAAELKDAIRSAYLTRAPKALVALVTAR